MKVINFLSAIVNYVKIKTKKVERVMVMSENSKAKAPDVFVMAKAFLTIASMTHKKLQKLCYYAKAWYLALYDENIIHEEFEAWVHGAVQPQLYQEYKQYGFYDIPKETKTDDIPEEFLSFAKEVYEAYGHLSGDELEAVNHTEDPWKNAREGLKPWEGCNNKILENDMKEYYRKKL